MTLNQVLEEQLSNAERKAAIYGKALTLLTKSEHFKAKGAFRRYNTLQKSNNNYALQKR